jgi:hypothetical protein
MDTNYIFFNLLNQQLVSNEVRCWTNILSEMLLWKLSLCVQWWVPFRL